MAKSMRSKVKRSFRSKKRESGVYAATEAARLNRLNAKLMSLASNTQAEDVPVEEEEGKEAPDVDNAIESPGQPDEMDLDTNTTVTADNAKRISTHGPRGSRREAWRISKGLGSRAKSKGMNRQASRKAGHPKTKR